jgi:poly-gamma-glutamate synthesis protein (capsule biosynthesis protein)
MFARGVRAAMEREGIDSPFRTVAAPLRAADVAFGNLEMTLTERGMRAEKDFTFRAPPSYAAALSRAGIDVMSLANNHSLDYGAVGLDDSLAALTAAGIRATGAGPNAAAAARPTSLEVNGLRVAVLAFAKFGNDSVSGFQAISFAAAASTPGVAWAAPETVGAAVAQAAAVHDVVIVSMHWGGEYQDAVSDEQRQLARAAVDAGAHLVLGHGPHVLQGWERIGKSLVVYSLGNFVFDLDEYDILYAGLPSTKSMVFQAELTPDGVGAAGFVPVLIDESTGFPVAVAGDAAEPVRARIGILRPSIAAAMTPAP